MLKGFLLLASLLLPTLCLSAEYSAPALGSNGTITINHVRLINFDSLLNTLSAELIATDNDDLYVGQLFELSNFGPPLASLLLGTSIPTPTPYEKNQRGQSNQWVRVIDP